MSRAIKDISLRQEISARFFQVIDLLKSNGTMKSLNGFCKEHGLNVPKYYKIRSQNEMLKGFKYKFIDIEALYYISLDYNISLQWLFYGVGPMFDDKRKTSN